MPYANEATGSSPKLLFSFPVITQPDEQYRLHSHVHHELVLVQSGLFHSRVQGNEYRAQTGDILFYPAHTPHEEWVEGDFPVVTLACAFECDDFGPSDAIFRKDLHGKIQQLITKLTSVHLLGEMGGSWQRNNHSYLPVLRDLIAELRALAPNERNAMVDQVRDFIRTNITKPLTVEDVATHVGLSRCHFTQLYGKIAQRTPKEEILSIKMEEAKRLILATPLPLSEIAPMVGITNEYHLSRLIKEHFGVGTRELRQSVRPPETQ